MIIHTSDCKPCPYCREQQKALIRRSANKRRLQKARFVALQKALQSGKVTRLYWRDDFTGFHYRQDKLGNFHYAGRT